MQRVGAEPVTITDWDQQIKVDMVVEKKTMLPQHLKVTRFHTLTVTDKTRGESRTSWGEFSTTYTFNWLVPADRQKQNDPPQDPALDFSHVTSKETALKLVSEGKLVKLLLFPAELGGEDIPENVVYVPPGTPEIRAEQVTDKVIRLVKERLDIQLKTRPEYKGDSFVPAKIHYEAWHSEERGRFKQTIEIW